MTAAFAASHAPMMLAAADSAPAAQHDAFMAGLRQAAARVRASGAEAVIILSNEHFTNFFLENFPQTCVGVAEANTGPAEPWLPIPRRPVPGSPALAHGLLSGLHEAGATPSFSEHLTLDHGIMTLYHAVDPDGRLPLVPLLQNCAVRPMLSLRQCFTFGQRLRAAIDACTAVDRVALVAAGGLSHWVGNERIGDIDEDFDRWFLTRLEKNSFDDVLDMDDAELDQAGNGAHEIRSWLTLAAAVDRPARVLAYEPIRAWVTGMGVAEYDMTGGGR
nr:hypothetical protein [Streptomyces sp. HNM0574]